MTDAEAICRSIYTETNEFLRDRLCNDNLGFKILYGPPLKEPEFLFIGYQPGGGLADCNRESENGAHSGWPARCEYAYETWTLAKQMQSMFGASLLDRCVALNAIFFRSPTVRAYGKNFKRNIRTEIEEFCLPNVRKIIDALNPQKIIFIGFDAMRLFKCGDVDLKNSNGRVLTMTGSVAGRNALATLHLSGCRISREDRKAIADRILNF